MSETIAQSNIAPGPGTQLVAITKSDTTVYNPPLRGLWVGGTGDVALLAIGSTVAVTLSAVPAGTLIDLVMIEKVMSTNTTASLMVGAI